MGQAGVYILHDPAEDSLNLPCGYGEYDIPLVLASKQYNADGTLFSTEGETDSLWGDVIEVVSSLQKTIWPCGNSTGPMLMEANNHRTDNRGPFWM